GSCGGSAPPPPQTDSGTTSDSILLGITIAQSGPAAAYGTIGNAELAYFTYVNGQGGVNGRKINFKILDDAYNPAQTVPLTKQLVENDQVFAMFSGLGTQDQVSVRDYLNSKKVPQLFVATGATTFNKDFGSNPWTLGWQPSYQGAPHIYAPDDMGLAKTAGDALKNVTSVGYLKDPTDPQWTNDEGMKLYKTIIASCSTCKPNDGFNIYGVAVAYTMVDVLKQAGTVMTRKN